MSKKNCKFIERYIKINNINFLFGFDQEVYKPIYKYIFKGGVGCFISYWGAPMADIKWLDKITSKKIRSDVI